MARARVARSRVSGASIRDRAALAAAWPAATAEYNESGASGAVEGADAAAGARGGAALATQAAAEHGGVECVILVLRASVGRAARASRHRAVRRVIVERLAVADREQLVVATATVVVFVVAAATAHRRRHVRRHLLLRRRVRDVAFRGEARKLVHGQVRDAEI